MKSNIVPRIDRPCGVSWSSLSGDKKRRYCEKCHLHVHNFSEMSLAERKAFLTKTAARKCMAYVGNDACAVDHRLLSRLYSLFGASRWVAASILGIFALGACASTKEEIMTPQAPPSSGKQVTETEDGKVYLGGIICEDRPLWKRILWPW